MSASLVNLKSNFEWTRIAFSSCVVIAVYLLLKVVKVFYSRRFYGKRLPGFKVPFFNFLGNLNAVSSKILSNNALDFNTSIMQLICGHALLFHKEKFFCFWISFAPFCLIAKAESVEALLSGTKIMQKSWSYEFLHPWLGTGLLTSYGAKWKSRRKLLTPSFHFEILKDFLPVFNEQSQRFVQKLLKDCHAPIDIVTPVTLCSLDIICETTLGVKINAQDNSESQYVKSVGEVANIIFQRSMNPIQWNDFLFGLTSTGREMKKHLKILHSFTSGVIQDKKRHLLSGDPDLNSPKQRRKALMDLLLEHHIHMKDLTEEDIREEVDTFAFEGHDTTSMGMSWCLYLIGLYPEIQKKIHEELDRIFGDDTERSATTDDLKDMQYLDRVLKESQRLYPSVPFIARQVTEDMEFCGHQLPKGATCTIFTYQLHRDPDVYPNPEHFDPDRFLPENTAKRHPYAYVPFSAGPRNCIGQRFAIMEEKVVISTVLRQFSLKSLDPRDKIIIVPELILRATTPLRVQFTPRK